MTNQTRTVAVSDKHREIILADILRRNEFRRRAGLPPRDLHRRMDMEVTELADAMFEDRLRPFVKQFYEETDGQPGLPGRVAQHIRVYAAAEEALMRETGLVRPKAMEFDLIKFIEKYEAGRLRDWGRAFSPVEH